MSKAPGGWHGLKAGQAPVAAKCAEMLAARQSCVVLALASQRSKMKLCPAGECESCKWCECCQNRFKKWFQWYRRFGNWVGGQGGI